MGRSFDASELEPATSPAGPYRSGFKAPEGDLPRVEPRAPRSFDAAELEPAPEPSLGDRARAALGRFERYGAGNPILAAAEALGGDGAGAALGQGIAEGGSGGMLGEISGAASAAKNLLLPPSAGGGATLADAGKAYREGRDQADKSADELTAGHEVLRNVGQFGGGLALDAAVGPIAGALATGAGNSNADLTEGDVGGFVKDTALAGAVGLVAKKAGKYAGKLADRVTEALAGKTAKAAAPTLEQATLNLYATAADTTAQEARAAARAAAKEATNKPLSAAAAKGKAEAASQFKKQTAKAARDAASEGVATPATAAAPPSLGEFAKDLGKDAIVDYAGNKLLDQVVPDLPYLPLKSATGVLLKLRRAHPGAGSALSKLVTTLREKNVDQAAAKALFQQLPLATAQAFADEIADLRKPAPAAEGSSEP